MTYTGKVLTVETDAAAGVQTGTVSDDSDSTKTYQFYHEGTDLVVGSNVEYILQNIGGNEIALI